MAQALTDYLASAPLSFAEANPRPTAGTELTLTVGSGTIDAGAGVSVGSNRFTIDAGTPTRVYDIACVLEIEGTGGHGGGGRLRLEGYAKKNGSEIVAISNETIYFRGGADHWRPGTEAHKFSGKVRLAATDYLTFHVIDITGATDGSTLTGWRINAADSLFQAHTRALTGSEDGLDQAAVDARIDALVAVKMTAAERSKLAGIEADATADQTAAEIVTGLQGLSGGDRLDASAVRNLPSGGGGVTTTQVRDLIAAATEAEIADLQESLATLEEAVFEFALTLGPVSTNAVDAHAPVAYALPGVEWSAGAFTQVTVDSHDPILIADDAVLALFASSGAGDTLGGSDALEFRLSTNGQPSQDADDTIRLGRDDDDNAYIAFDAVGPHTVATRSVTRAPLVTDDSLTGHGTAVSPLAVSTTAQLPPRLLQVSSEEQVASELGRSLSTYDAEDTERIHRALDQARSWINVRVDDEDLYEEEVSLGCSVLAAFFFNMAQAQGSMEAGNVPYGRIPMRVIDLLSPYLSRSF